MKCLSEVSIELKTKEMYASSIDSSKQKKAHIIRSILPNPIQASLTSSEMKFDKWDIQD